MVGYGHLGQYLADKILKDGKASGMCFISGLHNTQGRFETCALSAYYTGKICASSVDYTGKI